MAILLIRGSGGGGEDGCGLFLNLNIKGLPAFTRVSRFFFDMMRVINMNIVEM